MSLSGAGRWIVPAVLLAVDWPAAGQTSLLTPAPPLPAVVVPSFTREGAAARREGNGRFMFEAEVNGAKLPMLFDTGASLTSLRAEDAARAGIDMGALHYIQIMHTANGTAEFAPVTIATMTVGGITRHDVAASVARPGMLSANLLGQSFLSRLAGYRLDGDRLLLLGRQ